VVRLMFLGICLHLPADAGMLKGMANSPTHPTHTPLLPSLCEEEEGEGGGRHVRKPEEAEEKLACVNGKMWRISSRSLLPVCTYSVLCSVSEFRLGGVFF
jgi:hypothetical protein